VTAPKRGRPKGRVVGSWRARAEAAGLPMATFRRDALAEAFLERCPFAREWARNSVYRAAEGLLRTPTRHHVELIERAREISERVHDDDDYSGPHTWNGDPRDEERHGSVLRDMREAAHEEAADVLARAWDGEGLVAVWARRGRRYGATRGERLYVPGGSLVEPPETVSPSRGSHARATSVSVSIGSKTDPIETVIVRRSGVRAIDDDALWPGGASRAVLP
jgi:hypothetical protein